MYSEEKEVEKRDAQKDLELHRSECTSLRQIMDDIQAAKAGNTENKVVTEPGRLVSSSRL